MKKLKQDIYNLRYIMIISVIYSVIMQFKFNTICPLKGFLGINCPGCGLTHAAIYLLTGNVKLSITSNPTAIIWVISMLLFLVDRYIKKLKINIFPFLFIISGVITIIWYTINIIT